MKVCEYIVKLLNEHNVTHIFGYIGGYNQDIVDALHKNGGIKFILNYHEQASAFAVNAYSVIKEQPAVATSSGAPSSLNLVAGIAEAYFDSNPCVFIVGSAHSLATRKDKRLRQNTFEEIDMVHLVSDITKYAVKIENAKDIKYELEKAFYIANEGRKGPVLVDIPYNIAREEIDTTNLKSFEPPETNYDDFNTDDALTLLKNSQKPVILLGGGTRSSKARKYLKHLLDKVKIPVLASLCGLDTLSHNHECFKGFIGHYGNRYANLALANADCVFILGSRLDERQLGGYLSKFAEGCKVVRVDIDKIELGRKLPETISIYNSVENFLEKLSERDFKGMDFSRWLNVISIWEKRYPSYDLSKKELIANNFLHVISDYLPDDAIICADVGQNQMCTAQSLKLSDERRLINSAGYGSMGFSLPAAIGAAYAKKDTCIVSINGDGGIQMNIQELHTLKRDNLPVNVIILNNNCLGMIRRLQENMYDNNTFISVDGYSVPDFEAISKAYKIPYLKVSSQNEYKLVKDFISSKHPTLIEVCLPVEMTNYPEPGCLIDKQVPLLSDTEMELVKKECNFD